MAFIYRYANINLQVAGDTTVVAGVPERHLRVLNYLLTADKAVSSVQFKSGTGDVKAELILADKTVALSFIGSLVGPAFETNLGEPLVMNVGTNANVRGHLLYVEVK